MLGHRANILDPVHDTLDPRVWLDPASQTPILKQQHKSWITNLIFAEASHFHSDPEQWLKLILTGSLTTYQYSDASDVDISLFINPQMLPEWDRARLIALMIERVDSKRLPNTPFTMQAFVVPKNISSYDLYQPGLRSGYDIESDNWLVPPDKERIHNVEQEQNADYVYALECADKMERLLRYEPSKAVQYWHQIHARRRRDQALGKGDYSQANIVYKFLANRGLFPEISDTSGEYIAKLAGLPPEMAAAADIYFKQAFNMAQRGDPMDAVYGTLLRSLQTNVNIRLPYEQAKQIADHWQQKYQSMFLGPERSLGVPNDPRWS